MAPPPNGTIPREAITGLVLAGGRGRRMGGEDKGLLTLHEQPLAARALARLRPQVGPIGLSANRHLAAYRALGVPVWPDTLPDQPGPLAGLLTGLTHADTPWLASVPCDCPDFPDNVVARLADAVQTAGADLAVAVAPAPDEAGHWAPKLHPVFCLLPVRLKDDLALYLQQGGRRVRDWLARHTTVEVAFDDGAAFLNVNTPEDLRQRHAR